MKSIKIKIYFISLFLCITMLTINNIKASEYDCNQKNIEIEKDANGRDLFRYEQVFVKYENETCIYRNVKVIKYEYFNEERKAVNEKGYNSSKKLSYEIKRSYNANGYLNSINRKDYYANSKIKKNVNYSNYYNNDYRKRTITKYNSKGTKIYYAILIKHSNLKTKSNTVSNYYSNKKLKSRTYATYNTKGQKTYYKKSLNYSNAKAKQRTVYSNFTKGVWKSYSNINYRKKGNKIYKKNKTVTKRKSNAVKISVKKYFYNKKGQLKSNRYGNAYRKHYTYFSNNKVAKYYKHKYTKVGKLKRISYKYYSKNKPKPIINKPEESPNGIDPYTKCNYKIKVPKGMTINNFKDFCKTDDKNMNGIVDDHEVIENIIFTAPNTKDGRKKANNMFNILSTVVQENEIWSNWFEFEAQEDAILFGYHDYKNNYVIALAEFFELYDKENDMKRMLDSFKSKEYKVIGNIVTAK